MKALIIYDSLYGNTKLVAEAIGASLGAGASVVPASEARPSDMKGLDLLIVGSPTQGGRPTAAVKELLEELPPGALDGVRVTGFDTRLSAKDQGLAMRVLLPIIGYAAGRIASVLRSKGGRLVASPAGFIVDGKEGPLRQGEVQRAQAWAKQLQG